MTVPILFQPAVYENAYLHTASPTECVVQLLGLWSISNGSIIIDISFVIIKIKHLFICRTTVCLIFCDPSGHFSCAFYSLAMDLFLSYFLKAWTNILKEDNRHINRELQWNMARSVVIAVLGLMNTGLPHYPKAECTYETFCNLKWHTSEVSPAFWTLTSACFHRRPTLVPAFTSQKKSREYSHVYEKMNALIQEKRALEWAGGVTVWGNWVSWGNDMWTVCPRMARI